MITAQQWAEAKMHEALKADSPKVALAGEHIGTLLRSYYSIFTRQGINLTESWPNFETLRADAPYLKVDAVSLLVIHDKLPRSERDMTDCVRKVPGLLKDIELDCQSVFVTDREITRAETQSLLSFGYIAVISSFNRNEVVDGVHRLLDTLCFVERLEHSPELPVQIVDRQLQPAA